MSSKQINLPINFDDLEIDPSILNILNKRQSHRVYTEETMSLLQLSYLLFVCITCKADPGISKQ